MGYAVVCTGASKAGTTGGTFADSLTANTNDSLTIPNFINGGGRIIYGWGIDSDSVAEGELLLTRYESVHDTNHGKRFQVPAITPGGAATVAAHTFIKPPETIPVFPGDTITMTFTSTASDDLAYALMIEYDDLPGTKAAFTDWATVQALRVTSIGLNQLPVASGTAGQWGSTRALNADDTRLSADKYYAILGCTVQTQVTALSLISTTWGGQRIGIPVGALDLDTTNWFVKLSNDRNKPMIPVINANDAGNVLVACMDGEASTSPHVDWAMVELSSNPIAGFQP